jgi:precorrin-6B methylase 2
MTTSRLLLAAVIGAAISASCSRTPDRDPSLAASTTTAAASAPATPSVTASAPPAASASAAPSAVASASTDDPPTRAPDIEYVPTPENVVEKMLEAAKITKDDVLYDLGCGDGRIVVTAAKKFGIKAKGFDIDPVRVAESKENVKKAKVEHLVTIEHKDVFTLDLSPASVVTLYLLPELNVKLIPQLEKLKPGSRIVAHDFDMEGVEYEKAWTVIAKDHRTPANREHYVYLWKTPLKKTAVKKGK